MEPSASSSPMSPTTGFTNLNNEYDLFQNQEKDQDNSLPINFEDEEGPEPVDKNAQVRVEEPKIGLVFDSLDKLIEYYSGYGNEMGFEVSKRTSTKGDNGELKYVTVACARNGKSKRNSKNAFRLYPATITNCEAKIRASALIDGRWRISSIVLDHNHQLSTPSKVRYHRSNRVLRPYVKRQLEVNDRAGIRPNKNFNTFVVGMGGHDKVPFLEKDCRN